MLSLTDLTETRLTDPKYFPYRHSYKPLYPDAQLFVKWEYQTAGYHSKSASVI